MNDELVDDLRDRADPGRPGTLTRQRPRRAQALGGAHQTAGTVLTRVASLLLSMVASVVIARRLQPDGRGIYHVITTIASTAIALGHLSIEQAQTTLWADARHRRGLAANCLPLGMAAGGFAVLVAGTLAVLGHSILHLPHLGLVALALSGVPLGISTLYLTNIAVLNARMSSANKAVMAGAAIQCGGLIVLGLAGWLTVASVVALWVAAMAVPLFVLVVAAPPALRRFDRAVAWRTVSTGFTYHPGPVSIFLLLRVDVFILAAQVPAGLVGVYGLAVSVAEMSKFATSSMAQVALSRQIGGCDSQSATVTARMTRLTVLVGVASVFGVAISAPVLLPVAYGSVFAGAVPLLLLLAPGVLALCAAQPIFAFLLRLGSSRLVVLPCVVALVANVVLNLLLIPVLGAAGCSIASSVGYMAMAGLQTRLFLRKSGLRGCELLPRGAEVRALVYAVREVWSRRPPIPRRIVQGIGD